METGEPEDLGTGSGEEEEGVRVSGYYDPNILDYEDEVMEDEMVREKEDREREAARIAQRRRWLESDRAAKIALQEAETKAACEAEEAAAEATRKAAAAAEAAEAARKADLEQEEEEEKRRRDETVSARI